MKTFKHLGLIAFASLFAFACKNESQPELKTVETEFTASANTLDPNAHYTKAEFGIDGMTCAMGCAKTIEKKIAGMDGVKSAKVDFDKRMAMVEYDDAKVTTTSLEETVKKAGEVYSVIDMKTVESFSTENHVCGVDCKMPCCADKTMKDSKTCASDCEKACCATKEKI